MLLLSKPSIVSFTLPKFTINCASFVNCASLVQCFFHCPASVIRLASFLSARPFTSCFRKYCSRCKSRPAVEAGSDVVTDLPPGFALGILASIINRLGDAATFVSVLAGLESWCEIATGNNSFTTGTDIILLTFPLQAPLSRGCHPPLTACDPCMYVATQRSPPAGSRLVHSKR